MASFTNQAKNSSSILNSAKNTVSTFVNTIKSYYDQFLLNEDGGHSLLEDGGKIILEQSVKQVPTYNTLDKS